MKFTQARILLLTFSLGGMLILAAGCNGGSQDGDKTHDSIDTPQVVKVTPQDFPVNELPDSLFGKATATSEQAGLKVTPAKLIPVTAPLPEWLDQILSRESIVLFSGSIMKDMPDEVEFVQTASAINDAGSNLTTFAVQYSTRPSNASMLVYGAYTDEQHAYWASQSSKDPLDMRIQSAKVIDNGVELMGEWAKKPKAVPFKATLTKTATTLVNGK
jgi:hypothetical protein